MPFKMARGVIEFLLRDDHLRRGIAKAQSALKTMQASMQVASRWARNLLIAMGGGFLYLVKTASSAQETTSKFKAVFKEQSKAASAFARDLASSVNRAEIDIKSWLSTLQDTFVPMGFARDKARLFSQQLVKLGIDLASFNDTADVEVIRSLQSAIVGNHETMRKYGVIIMQATLDQELLRMGYKGGAKAATEQAKAQARLNIIMAGTVDAQGDAARTAHEFANTWKGFKASIVTAASAIGALLLPALGKLVMTARDAVDVIGGLSKTEMKGLLDAAKTAGKWLILIWAAPALLSAANSFIGLLGRIRGGLLRIKGVSATTASAITGGLVIALGILAAAYANVKMQAASAYAAMFQIAVQSRTHGRLVRDLRKAEAARDRASNPADRLAALKRIVTIREQLVDLGAEEEEKARQKKLAATDRTFLQELQIYATGPANIVTGKQTELLENYKQLAETAQDQIGIAQREQREYIKGVGAMQIEIEQLEQAEERRAKAGGLRVVPETGAAAAGAGPATAGRARGTEAPRPEFIGLQEMHRRLATAGTRRAEDLARMQFDLLKRTANDTERSREALESMARAATAAPASVVP